MSSRSGFTFPNENGITCLGIKEKNIITEIVKINSLPGDNLRVWAHETRWYLYNLKFFSTNDFINISGYSSDYIVRT